MTTLVNSSNFVFLHNSLAYEDKLRIYNESIIYPIHIVTYGTSILKAQTNKTNFKQHTLLNIMVVFKHRPEG